MATVVALGSAFAAAGAIGFAVVHKGSTPAKPARAVPAGSVVTLRGGVTTTTTPSLSVEQFTPGQCVTWDQTKAVSGTRQTSVVPCTRPHLIEIASDVIQITGFGPTYPGAAALDTYSNKVCPGPDDTFLGDVVDPDGRFAVGGLTPTSNSWATGDNTLWCDIQLTSTTTTSLLTAFSGDVRGADQTLLAPVGSCQKAGPFIIVACTGPHTVQITGNVNLAEQVFTLPKNDAQWQSIMSQPCGQLARSFLGGAYPAGVRSGWYVIEPTSWDAGRRIAQCTVGQYTPGGTIVTITRSLRDAVK